MQGYIKTLIMDFYLRNHVFIIIWIIKEKYQKQDKDIWYKKYDEII